jgi:hypothetical protein
MMATTYPRPRQSVDQAQPLPKESPQIMELTERTIRVEEKLSGVDKRLELVEKDLRDISKKIDSHFFALGGMIIAAAVGLAGIMGKGFHWF